MQDKCPTCRLIGEWGRLSGSAVSDFGRENEIPCKGNLLVDDESEFSLALVDGRRDHRDDEGRDDWFRLGCKAARRVTGDEWPFAANS